MSAMKPLKVLLPTLGSAGDVHPLIALGLKLRARGHRAMILTSPFFQPLIEQQGLEFLAVGTIEDARAAFAYPDLWHPRKGLEHILRMTLPAIEQMYRLIAAHADSNTVVAASSLSIGARVAQDRLGVPTATVHLQPGVFRSLVDQGMVGSLRIAGWQPRLFKRAFYRLADWVVIDRILQRPLNEFRATLGLAPVSRVFHHWFHSPQCVIGFFPEWFAAPQPDWPPNTHLVGFPLWDGGDDDQPLAAEAKQFLNDGEAPIIFTPGSAGSTMHRYFGASVEAVSRLNRRAMLVTNYPQQLPRALPSGVKAFGYLPFSQVLPRAALLVYHGGIGTLAQATQAGIPHLVVPHAHDQFDNGWRIEQMGLGRSIWQARYRAARVVEAIRNILGDEAIARRCRGYAARMDSAGALTRACTLIEGLAR
jgi:rhamnosyltransferase subunit B